ncbi:DUF4303 domain-containing protein [Microbulbifer sp. ANSA003]|uniref:DUF4303 domain-containing protein n=1 Tax=Microbulbifer sp. ANSA003 TaxID=3243360 RepID=UPI0040421A90
MNPEIRNLLQGLLDLLEESIVTSMESIVKDKNPYGYALLIGEDLDCANVVVVTNSEENLKKYSAEEDVDDYRYIPDEWDDWHYEDFKDFNEKLDEVYSRFAETHIVTDDECLYTEDALDYMNALYSLYIQAMANVREKNIFPSIWYRLVWISDSDRNVIANSFYELNDGRALKEASYLFEQ